MTANVCDEMIRIPVLLCVYVRQEQSRKEKGIYHKSKEEETCIKREPSRGEHTC